MSKTNQVIKLATFAALALGCSKRHTSEPQSPTVVIAAKAHGLDAKQITEVTAGAARWTPAPGRQLFLDVHHVPAGKVTATDVEAAHAKDVAVEGKYGVRYLAYSFDAASGTIVCLAEAPDAEAALAVHKEAHGLIPQSIEQVSEGR